MHQHTDFDIWDQTFWICVCIGGSSNVSTGPLKRRGGSRYAWAIWVRMLVCKVNWDVGAQSVMHAGTGAKFGTALSWDVSAQIVMHAGMGPKSGTAL